MAKELSKEQHDEIFNTVKRNFSDFHLFDRLVAENLKNAIIESNNIEINHLTTKKVVERYFDVHSFKTQEQKLLLAQISLIFKSCYVLILTYQPEVRQLMWDSVHQFKEAYPEFADVEEEELDLLLKFRNMLRVTLLLIPARLNKSVILKIAGRLEGSQNEYITGGGQKKEVQRRVTIYEQEGGVSAERRPERKRKKGEDEEDPHKSSASGTKRSDTSFTYKKLKQVRLASEEVKTLARPADPMAILPAAVANTIARPQHPATATTALTALSNVAAVAARVEADINPRVTFTNMPSSSAGTMNPPSMALKPTNLDMVSDVASRGLPMGDIPVDLARGWSMGAISLPSLSRETSDVLDKYINDTDFWSENMQDIRQPSTMARNISLSLYDGSFKDTLNSMGDFNLPRK